MRSNFSLVRALAVSVVLASASIAAIPAARAQQQGDLAQVDPIAQRLFAPEFVMAHADDIDLTANQRQRIIEAVSRLQGDMLAIAPRAESARGQVVAALSVEQVDEARVLEALDGVLAVERDIKRLHIATLVRIRNHLTPRQRTRLNELR